LPRLILVDIGLPDVEGVDTIRRLKAAIPYAEMVAMPIDNHRLPREAAGASAYVGRWKSVRI
jgi:DNA-binding NarL/FixJ family response regulator